MKTGCTTGAIADLVGEDEAIRLIAKGGYDCLDFSVGGMTHDDHHIWNSDGYREEAERIRRVCQKNNVEAALLHTPFLFSWQDPEAMEKIALPRTIRSLEIAGILGAPIAIVHPIHDIPYSFYGDMLYKKNIAFYRYLLPYAKKYNVKIALENMFQYDSRGNTIPDMYADIDEFKRALEELSDPFFCACVDVGHCGLGRCCTAGEMIRALGDHVQALHVHDNDNTRDTHTVPYLGTMDWEDICSALREINYQGVMNLEVLGSYYKRFTEPALLEKAIRFSNDIARHLADKITR